MIIKDLGSIWCLVTTKILSRRTGVIDPENKIVIFSNTSCNDFD